MLIVADENIPYIQEAFATLGEVVTVSGRTLTSKDLKQAEILLVRSVTPVNVNLLADSAVRFVGTATIGCDHIDLAYLQQQGIQFAHAPGSNATSTAEYVLSALLVLAEQQNFNLSEKTVGIIGCGNVGSRVLRKLESLGVTCIVYDPPLQERTHNATFVDLASVLTADIVTLHVPLEKTGLYPTYHLVNEHFLRQLSPRAVLINTSRGEVIDETALLHALTLHPEMTVILDVWKGEPHINLTLLQRAALATSHIAGYSLDGKARGTEMIYAAACHFIGSIPQWHVEDSLPAPPLTQLSFSEQVEKEIAVRLAVMACYDIRRDDAKLRLSFKMPHAGPFFDQLRKHYPIRREFNCVQIEISATHIALQTQLEGIGFSVKIASQEL